MVEERAASMTLQHQGLDHIYFKARDTLHVQRELRQLGFHTTEIDTSTAGDVTIVSAVFQDSWISIGASTNPDQAAEWMSMFAFGATPVVLLRTTDNPSFMETLRSMGATLPIDLMTYHRPTSTPAGPATLSFEMSTALAGPIPAPVVITGIRQLTAANLFRADLTAQPNEVSDLDAFTIEIASVAAAMPGLTQIFGESNVRAWAHQASIELGNARLILSESAALANRYGEMYAAGNTTFARFRVRDLAAFEQRLKQASVAFKKLEQPASLAVSMASLNGCIFEFVQS